jgi:hypothetical protein
VAGASAGRRRGGRETDRTLTLSQVREAGRFAWHPKEHYVFSGGLLLRVTLPCGRRNSAGLSNDVRLSVRVSSLHGDERMIRDGWRHLANCDCPFCMKARQQQPEAQTPHLDAPDV